MVLVMAHWGFGLVGAAAGRGGGDGRLPVGSNALIFAQRYETLQAEATAAIVVSTLAFALTAPLWLAVLALAERRWRQSPPDTTFRRDVTPTDIPAYMAHLGAAARAAATRDGRRRRRAPRTALRELARAAARGRCRRCRQANAPTSQRPRAAGLRRAAGRPAAS